MLHILEWMVPLLIHQAGLVVFSICHIFLFLTAVSGPAVTSGHRTSRAKNTYDLNCLSCSTVKNKIDC